MSRFRHPTTGRRVVVFNVKDALVDRPINVPCGRCTNCKLERSRQWALRCVNEAQLYNNNCFITLTYSDKYLPSDYSVSVREMQLFMKRLRKRYDHKIKVLYCGEYGETTLRPHYHGILFNHDFDDRVLHSINNGVQLDVSETLTKIWNKGHTTVGDATFESAGYVARYCTKKITGEGAEAHYTRIHPITGKVVKVQPEFLKGSSIGKEWFKKYSSDVYPSDFMITRGHKCRPPKYYDKLLEKQNPEMAAQIRSKRSGAAKSRSRCGPSKWSQERNSLRRLERLPRNLGDNDGL